MMRQTHISKEMNTSHKTQKKSHGHDNTIIL